jgi:hypothetical protein
MEPISTITFCYTLNYNSNTEIKYSIKNDFDLSSMCEGFENFLLACGFRLKENAHIGVVYEEETQEQLLNENARQD